MDWGGVNQLKYLRKHPDIIAHGKQGSCSPALEVLEWIEEVVNGNIGTFIVAYGALIHIKREKDFVHPNIGKFVDDSIDVLATMGTISLVGTLEPQLFKQFGWTIRVRVNPEGYVVMMEMMVSCGHMPRKKAGPIRGDQPAIELYPVGRSIISPGGNPAAKDIWEDDSFEETMLFPPQHICFKSTASPHSLQLQIPNKPFDFLECMYGNWRVPLRKHSPRQSTLCVKE